MSLWPVACPKSEQKERVGDLRRFLLQAGINRPIIVHRNVGGFSVDLPGRASAAYLRQVLAAVQRFERFCGWRKGPLGSEEIDQCLSHASAEARRRLDLRWPPCPSDFTEAWMWAGKSVGMGDSCDHDATLHELVRVFAAWHEAGRPNPFGAVSDRLRREGERLFSSQRKRARRVVDAGGARC